MKPGRSIAIHNDYGRWDPAVVELLPGPPDVYGYRPARIGPERWVRIVIHAEPPDQVVTWGSRANGGLGYYWNPETRRQVFFIGADEAPLERPVVP